MPFLTCAGAKRAVIVLASVPAKTRRMTNPVTVSAYAAPMRRTHWFSDNVKDLDTASVGVHFPDEIRNFVESTVWTFAKTYAATWPHEYVVQNAKNASMILALARHIFEHGTDGRFYSQIRKYHHEGGKVYWSMASTPEEATLINRCREDQTYEARLAAGALPKPQFE